MEIKLGFVFWVFRFFFSEGSRFRVQRIGQGLRGFLNVVWICGKLIKNGMGLKQDVGLSCQEIERRGNYVSGCGCRFGFIFWVFVFEIVLCVFGWGLAVQFDIFYFCFIIWFLGLSRFVRFYLGFVSGLIFCDVDL